MFKNLEQPQIALVLNLLEDSIKDAYTNVLVATALIVIGFVFMKIERILPGLLLHLRM